MYVRTADECEDIDHSPEYEGAELVSSAVESLFESVFADKDPRNVEGSSEEMHNGVI